jgi:hypothetical protein
MGRTSTTLFVSIFDVELLLLVLRASPLSGDRYGVGEETTFDA